MALEFCSRVWEGACQSPDLRQSRRLENISPSKGLKPKPKPLTAVTPAKAGVQNFSIFGNFLDSGFRRNDRREVASFSKKQPLTGLEKFSLILIIVRFLLPELSNPGSPPAEPGVYLKEIIFMLHYCKNQRIYLNDYKLQSPFRNSSFQREHGSVSISGPSPNIADHFASNCFLLPDEFGSIVKRNGFRGQS